jgi:hypothetical protein
MILQVVSGINVQRMFWSRTYLLFWWGVVHLSGYVNSQNNRYWSTEYPHAVYEISLHGLKVGVWCAVSAWRTIQSMSFHETVIYECYTRLFLSPFFGQLTNEEKLYEHFMWDNATAHTANNSLVALDEICGERAISWGLWPLWSLILSTCGHTVRKMWTVHTFWNKLKKILGMKFLLLLYGNFDVRLETHSHYVRHV